MARACDVLLLTVPDDMLGRVVAVLVGQRRAPDGQPSCTRAVATAWRCSNPRRPRVPPAGAPRDAVHRHGRRPARLAGVSFGVSAGPGIRLAERLVPKMGAVAVWVSEDKPRLYHAASPTAPTT